MSRVTDPGLLDLPAPLLSAIDGVLAGAPPWLRLIFWGASGALLSMALYRLLSRQQALAETKQRLAAAQRELVAYDGEFDGLLPRIAAVLRASGRQLWLTLWPTIAASLPLLFLLAWLSNAYGYRLPAVGEPLAVSVTPATLPLPWQGPLAWPAQSVTYRDSAGEPLFELPLSAPVPLLHKRQWWNGLQANPLGYLPAAGAIEQIEFQLPEQVILPFGPTWLRGWLPTWLLATMACSLLIKWRWRLH